MAAAVGDGGGGGRPRPGPGPDVLEREVRDPAEPLSLSRWEYEEDDGPERPLPERYMMAAAARGVPAACAGAPIPLTQPPLSRPPPVPRACAPPTTARAPEPPPPQSRGDGGRGGEGGGVSAVGGGEQEAGLGGRPHKMAAASWRSRAHRGRAGSARWGSCCARVFVS